MGTQRNPPSNLRSKPSFSQYVSVRQRLDDLGYNCYLSNDSVPLVDKLLSDLLHYKEQCSGNQKSSTAKQVPLFRLSSFLVFLKSLHFLQRSEHTRSVGTFATEYSNENESIEQNSNHQFLLNEHKYISKIEGSLIK